MFCVTRCAVSMQITAFFLAPEPTRPIITSPNLSRMDSTPRHCSRKQGEIHSQLPFSHRRRPKRDKVVRDKDCLSPLPLELFLHIIRYTDDRVPKPFATLKSLSMVNKSLRAKCISAGLFQSLFVTLHRGTNSIRNVCYMLRNKSIPADYVHTLTIDECIIGECPSELARLLQLLTQLKTFRIRGNRQSQPPLNCGRLISFNGMLHKTFSSRSHLTKLENVEIINMSITQIIIDIIAALPRYHRLELRRSQFVRAPDLMTTTLCNPTFLHMHGDIGEGMWVFSFLRTTTIARSIRYLCVHANVFFSLFAVMKLRSVSLTVFLPALKTLYLLTSCGYSRRNMNFLEGLRIPHVVWRNFSFLRQPSSLYVSP